MSGNYLLETNAPASKLVFLDSRDGIPLKKKPPPSDEYFTTDLSFTFADLLEVPEHVDTLLSVHSATIPYSFYTIRKYINDTLTYRVNTSGGAGVLRELYITPAQYDGPALAKEVTRLMKSAGDDVTVTYEAKYLKMFFKFDALDASPYKKITFINSPSGRNYGESIYSELGLPANDNVWFDNTGASSNPPDGETDSSGDTLLENGLLAPDAADLTGSTHNIHLRTSLTTTATIDSMSRNFTSVLCRFPVNPNANKLINVGHMAHQALIKVTALKNIKIALTDDRNRLIDLNGMHFSCALLFCFAYTKKPIPQLSREERRFISSWQDRKHLKHRMENYKKKAQDKVNNEISKQTIQRNRQEDGGNGQSSRSEGGIGSESTRSEDGGKGGGSGGGSGA